MNLLKRNQKGDTVLEVMICVAVLGFILAAAFTLTNRNQIASREAQERGEAIKLAETQLELLRTFADIRKLPHKPPYNQDYFCIFNATGTETTPGVPDNPLDPNDNTGLKLRDFASGNPEQDPNTDGFADYPEECNPPNSNNLYHVAIWAPGAPAGLIEGTADVYAITVRWDSARGLGRDEVKMFYTVYDTSNPLFATAPATACSDTIDNDNDGQTDWTQDPDCNNDPADNSESNLLPPPPPPPPPPTDWVRKGGEFTGCVPAEAFLNDGNDGCFTNASNGRNPNVGDMWARRNFSSTYSLLDGNGNSQVGSGPQTLQIKYKEYTDPAPAPPGYSYRVHVYLGVGAGPNYVSRGTFNLSAGPPGSDRTYNASINIPGGASAIRLVWENNSGSDPDLMLVELKIEN